MKKDDNDIYKDMVAVSSQRKEPLSQIDWASKLVRFFESQPGMKSKVSVSNIRTPDNAGLSSTTILFTVHLNEGQGSIDQKYVLRTTPKNGLFHEYDMGSQYEIIKALQRTDVPVPTMVGLDPEGAVFGTPSLIMEQINAIALPQNMLDEGHLFEASLYDRKRMIIDIITNINKIHNVDWRSLGLQFLEKRGEGKNVLERTLNWHLETLRCRAPEGEKEILPMYRWLIDNQPRSRDVVLCHGDVSVHNFMFHGNRVAAVLDWELSCLNPPEVDLAWLVISTRGYNLGHDEPFPGIPANDKEWTELYESISGRKVRDWDYFYVYSGLIIYMITLAYWGWIGTTSEMAIQQRKKMCDFTWQHINEKWEKAESSTK